MNNGRSIGVLIVVAIVAAFIGYQVGHTAGESQVRTRLTAKAGRIESDLLATISARILCPRCTTTLRHISGAPMRQDWLRTRMKPKRSRVRSPSRRKHSEHPCRLETRSRVGLVTRMLIYAGGTPTRASDLPL